MENTNSANKKSRLPFIITLIVIAVIFAIVTVVVISVFQTKEDPDVAIAVIINNNNKAKAYDSFRGYQNAADIGYVLDDLALSKSSRVILWDSVNDCYLLYDGDELVYSPVENPSTGTKLWIYVSKPVSESKFSVYSTEVVATTPGTESSATEHIFEDHLYNITFSGEYMTYTCTENGCGYSYTVKVTK